MAARRPAIRIIPSTTNWKRRDSIRSFRGDAKHRTRNLEIRRCAIAHLRSGPSDHPGMTTSVRREAVQQSVAAGALEVVLRAATVGAARGMRRVPRLRRVVVTQANAIGVADHG